MDTETLSAQRQQLKDRIVTQAIEIQPSGLRVDVKSKFRSVKAGMTIQRAAGARDADRMKGYVEDILRGLLESLEGGLGELLDARLATLLTIPPAELPTEIGKLRADLKDWGSEGRDDWAWRNPARSYLAARSHSY